MPCLRGRDCPGPSEHSKNEISCSANSLASVVPVAAVVSFCCPHQKCPVQTGEAKSTRAALYAPRHFVLCVVSGLVGIRPELICTVTFGMASGASTPPNNSGRGRGVSVVGKYRGRGLYPKEHSGVTESAAIGLRWDGHV